MRSTAATRKWPAPMAMSAAWKSKKHSPPVQGWLPRRAGRQLAIKQPLVDGAQGQHAPRAPVGAQVAEEGAVGGIGQGEIGEQGAAARACRVATEKVAAAGGHVPLGIAPLDGLAKQIELL